MSVKVAELIEQLKQMPQDAIVTHCDGENGRMVVTRIKIEPDYYLPDVMVVEFNSRGR